MILNKLFETTLLFPMARYQTIALILFGIPSVHNSLHFEVDFILSQSSNISFSHIFASLSSFWICIWIFFVASSFFCYCFLRYSILFYSTSLLTFLTSSSDCLGRLFGRYDIGSMPLGTLVLPLLTAMNFMRSFHSEENTDPRVLDTDCGGCCYCICFYPF